MHKKQSIWPTNAISLARELHKELSLDNKNWHNLKGNPDRRAAELISSAIIQLLSNGKNEDTEALLQQSILWIRRDIKDPGCPHN